MNHFRFESIWVFLFLPLVAGFLWLMWREISGSAKRAGALLFSDLRLVKKFQEEHPTWGRRLLVFLRGLALVFLLLALARPQTGKTMTEENTEVVDVALILDTSGSMRALDFMLKGERVTRLEAVKSVVSEFIRNRSLDRMGMVVFGEQAFTQCPQTLDHGVLLDFLDTLEIGMAGDRTAIGVAIGVAVKRLKDLPSKSRIAILLTDGQNNVETLLPDKAAEIAKTFGIKIYTIGVGSRGKAPFLVQGFFGKQLVYQDVDLDEETLQRIAQITNGRYFRATDTESLRQIYQEIDRLERTEVKVKQYQDYREHFMPFAFVGLGFLLLEVALGQTLLRKVP